MGICSCPWKRQTSDKGGGRAQEIEKPGASHIAAKNMLFLRLFSFITFLAVLAAPPTPAQTGITRSNQKTEKTAGTMDCPDPDARVACRSFQELLAAKDEDLMYNLKPAMGQVFICFRPKEDVFFLLRGSDPDDERWEKKERSAIFTQSSAVELSRFKNGVFDHGGESAFARGEWSSTDKGRTNATFANEDFASEGGSKGEIEIDGGTVTVSHSLEKMGGNGAQYSFKLQKSTGRFTETFTAPNTPEHQVVGRCLKWNPN